MYFISIFEMLPRFTLYQYLKCCPDLRYGNIGKCSPGVLYLMFQMLNICILYQAFKCSLDALQTNFSNVAICTHFNDSNAAQMYYKTPNVSVYRLTKYMTIVLFQYALETLTMTPLHDVINPCYRLLNMYYLTYIRVFEI